GTWQKESKLYPVVEVFAGNMVKILSLEDELATLQSMMDPNADKTQLIQKALGGGQGKGDGVGGVLSKLGGIGSLTEEREDITQDMDDFAETAPPNNQADPMSKILDSFEGPQKEIIKQAIQAMRAGQAHSLMEGAIQSKDSTGASLLDETMQYMDPTEKLDLHKKIKEMDAGMQATEKSIFEKQD
ncbi:MAG: hypothetical protein K9M55_08250, partial [Candidatus Marinimicrobia bacterium]|nr:hypothetical protein [Candidatus Neomarinimicrobiota bacterium]MCF7922679.1 hypothetical protein [Candidatus Neomarinimicrobiota bacterium]